MRERLKVCTNVCMYVHLTYNAICVYVYIHISSLDYLFIYSCICNVHVNENVMNISI